MNKYINSEKYFEQAQKVIPGGVDSPVRAFGSVGHVPVFAQKGEGAVVTDEDGNRYIDFIQSWGPLILGHANPVYLDGVKEVLGNGTTFGLPTKAEIDLAETMVDLIDSVEQVRFVNSGTEAVMSAIRLARGYTNREKFIKFEGCYHGHADHLLVKSGSGTLTYGHPSSLGVTEGAAKDTLIAQYNDLESVRKLFDENQGEIAAVIVEPVAGNMGVIAPQEGFLEGLRELCSENGALLIFDEVITGFRVGLNGMQGRMKIHPDISVFGKIIGGGMPVGAFGSRAEIMNLLSPLGGVYQAGTLSGNPLAMKMGKNTLDYLKDHPEVYTHMEKLAEKMEDGLNQILDETGLPASVNRAFGMITLFFTEEAPNNFEMVSKADTALYAKWFEKMLDRGYLLPPSQFEGIFLSEAHTEEMIDQFLTDAKEVMFELKD